MLVSPVLGGINVHPIFVAPSNYQGLVIKGIWYFSRLGIQWIGLSGGAILYFMKIGRKEAHRIQFKQGRPSVIFVNKLTKISSHIFSIHERVHVKKNGFFV